MFAAGRSPEFTPVFGFFDDAGLGIMRLDTSQQMRTDMRMRMAPRMIQSMEILQLPLMALQERIDQEMIENPLLVDQDGDPDDAEPVASTEDYAEQPGEAPEPTESADDSEADFGEFVDDEWRDSYDTNHRVSRSAIDDEADRKHDAIQNVITRPRSMQDELAEQLAFLDLEPTVEALAEAIIHSLDENGYFTGSLAEIVDQVGEPANLELAEQALAVVQKLDPPGIGARNLRECLLLQLTPQTPLREVLHKLISNHLDDLQQNRLPKIERETGIPIETIKESLDRLRRLNPRPGARFDSEPAGYVLPDLVVELDDQGEYVVKLVDDYTPRLSISRYYQQLLKNKNAEPETREYIQKKIQSARWLIESIEQRRNTLLKVARAVIDHQKDFLDKGPEWIEPLKMQQIADRVHVHVTTVSRAVDDKWVQTPRGVFPLKRFFGGGTTTSDGESVAWDTIKQKLLEIIGKEDKHNPLSDEEIVDALSQGGVPVARRTVTKYRKALRIPSSRKRKEY